MARIYRTPFSHERQVTRWLRRNTAGALLGHSESAAPVTLGDPTSVSTLQTGGGTSTVVGPSVIDVFTSSGTWTKPGGAVFVHVILIGGGAGGSSGANATIGVSPTFYFGGSGGQPGSLVRANFFGPDLPATLTVTVGAAAAGKVFVTGAGFRNAEFGQAGNPSRISGSGFPAIVATGGANIAAATSDAAKSVGPGSAGAGGGSVTVFDAVSTDGGSTIDRIHGLTMVGGTAPGGNGASCTSFPGTGAFYPNGGGGGGAGNGVGVGGNGGNGGFPAGGGGGGGAGSGSSANGGNGGNGGGGLVVFLTNF